jgi:predicted PurR-regulated permease PerM
MDVTVVMWIFGGLFTLFQAVIAILLKMVVDQFRNLSMEVTAIQSWQTEHTKLDDERADNAKVSRNEIWRAIDKLTDTIDRFLSRK